MKLAAYIKLFLVTCLVALPIASGAVDKEGEDIQYSIPEKNFIFQPVVDGTEVVHDFVILNKGTEALSIFNVKAG
jgi:hypothetical protein